MIRDRAGFWVVFLLLVALAGYNVVDLVLGSGTRLAITLHRPGDTPPPGLPDPPQNTAT